MKIIGLTGGIASGKSTASEIISTMGYPVVDADEISIELAEPGQPIWQAYKDRYGEKVLYQDGSLNRKAVAALVFSDKDELAWANSMSHPIIHSRIKAAIKELEAMGADRVFLDIPLLFEAGFQDMTDAVWLVYISPACQLSRLMERNGYSQAEAKMRIDAQMSIDEKCKLADVIIDNQGTIEELRINIIKELENGSR